ncbi:MAG: cation diffusion facilitator family transporter [Magnetococcales bacterium]|nr:cation diffusion facilitator family transporter [Magnetococcales bacterium]
MIDPRCRACRDFVIVVDVLVSLAQMLFLGAMGSLTGSMALHALALNALGDFLARGVTLISLKIASWRPTPAFPYGFGKLQFLASGLVGIGLCTGSALLLAENVRHINERLVESPGFPAILAALVGLFSSEMMHRFQRCAGVRNNSPIIRAAAADNRADALSFALVALGLLLAFFGLAVADHIVATLVSILVIRMGLTIVAESFHGLMDAALPGGVMEQIHQTVRNWHDQVAVEMLRGRKLGDRWEIHLTLRVPADWTTVDAHAHTQQLRASIHRHVPHTGEVLIAILPSQEEGSL